MSSVTTDTIQSYYSLHTAKAPVNIAVIKYWGKQNEELKIPLHNSISGTLDINDMCATTSIAISSSFQEDELWLNGKKQKLDSANPAGEVIRLIRLQSKMDKTILSYKAHIVSVNNFPTAAGLASSAAGYACLAFVLGHAYGITDCSELSKLARLGSGSACRSLFGGFVMWEKGHDHDDSYAKQLANNEHWPEMRVIICVANDKQKDVSSSSGMQRSVETSTLIQHRKDTVVPDRVKSMKLAIQYRDWDSFAKLTMKDSNQFHAICLDTYPPIFYLNEASRHIIKICTYINEMSGGCKVAYTFDAGPNACIYVLEPFMQRFASILKYFFPSETGLEVKGQSFSSQNDSEVKQICEDLEVKGITKMKGALQYLISTRLGSGPVIIQNPSVGDIDPNLRP